MHTSLTRAQGARRQRWRWTPLLLSSLALLGVMVVATGVGSVRLAPALVLTAVWHGVTGELVGSGDTIVWQIRLPRVLLAALVGASLALAGVVYQGIFRNPLADPYLLGVASGAGFGAALVIAFAAAVPWLAALGVPLAAFASALLTVALVMTLARQGRSLPLVALILAGVVVGSSLTAATSFMMLMAREQAVTVLAWLLGSFGLASWGKLVSVLPFVFVAGLVTLMSARALNLMQLGDEQAAQLGLPVEAFKRALIVVATLATAAAVSVSGIIGFVGLMVPHAVRLAFGPDHRLLVPLAALWGALFMVLADLLARTLISPAEIPVGVVTALAGGPFFLYLLRRQGRRTA
ncbi:MAG: iron ABC transporter permease [Deinococcota bacterium]|nr:iron ABC transporter permease [Deinococcota bacterium]